MKVRRGAHLNFSVLNNLDGKISFKVARHTCTNQLGFLWLPTQVGALG